MDAIFFQRAEGDATEPSFLIMSVHYSSYFSFCGVSKIISGEINKDITEATIKL